MTEWDWVVEEANTPPLIAAIANKQTYKKENLYAGCTFDYEGPLNDFHRVLVDGIGRGEHLMSFCSLQQGNKQSIYQRS